jgi:hypothetical protein
MPKIGVLTFHRCINYGSYWQARCLVEGLRARGHEAVLLDHDSGRVNLAEWRCALRPVLPTAVPASDYRLYGDKIRAFFHAFSALPLSRRFPLEDSSEMETFDLVVVGSDEVWNLSHPWYGGYSLFFGHGVRAARLVSYAASFGSYAAAEGLHPWWVGHLRRFEAVSVRDENSRRLIRESVRIDPELVLDPCLQFDLPLAGTAGLEAPTNGPYVAVYGHNFSGGLARRARRWAQARGYSLVSIGYRNDWADAQWISAGPHEFARFVGRAEAVVTNFFHGCVFALRERKPFVCEAPPYRSNKIRDLMSATGGEQHLVSATTAAAAYDGSLSEPLRPELLDRIARLRRTADEYLDLALA